MEEFPSEILLQIFQHLDTPTFLHSSRCTNHEVCSRWYSISQIPSLPQRSIIKELRLMKQRNESSKMGQLRALHVRTYNWLAHNWIFDFLILASFVLLTVFAPLKLDQMIQWSWKQLIFPITISLGMIVIRTVLVATHCSDCNSLFEKAHRFGLFALGISKYPHLLPYLLLTVLPLCAATMFLILRFVDFVEISFLRILSPMVFWSLAFLLQLLKGEFSKTLIATAIIIPIEFFICFSALQLDRIIQVSWCLVNVPLFFWLCGILTSLLRPHVGSLSLHYGNFSLWILGVGLLLAFHLMSVTSITEAVTINWRFAFTPIWFMQTLVIRPNLLPAFFWSYYRSM